VTPPAIVSYLQVASTAALVIIAALTARDWLATRDRTRIYLVLAIGSLAAVSLLGQVGKLLGSWFAAASGSVTVVLFLASGLALLMFRDSVIPLSRRARRVVLMVVAATGVLEIGLQLIGSKTAPKPIQLIALVAFVLVWAGCVGEPSVRLWLEARGRAAVQRARMRALSFAYLAIVAILLAAVFTASLGKQPAVQVGFALAGLAIIPLLYAAFVPPAWLRRLWRQGEEAKLQEATHDIVLFSPDRATLAGRALDWAVRLTGADSGLFVGKDGHVLASHRMTSEAAAAVREQLASAGDQPVIALGGAPPRNAVIVEIPGAEARIVLVTGPFTPVFGTDEQSWIRQYASLVSTGLDRVRLVEAVERANLDLQAKVEEVIERTNQLEAANRELEAFSYTISHDLRAPLRAINGFTSILLDDFAESLPEQARGYLVKVKGNGEQMGRLVDDLLAFSRLGRQGLPAAAGQYTGDRRSGGGHAVVVDGEPDDPTRGWRSPRGARRPRSARAGLRQLAQQRDQVHAQKAVRAHRGGRLHQCGRRGPHVLRTRQRRRIRHDLCREAIWGLPASAPQSGLRGDGSRPGHRPSHHRPPRRADLGRRKA
jgi:signal transduction histidine kinase